MSDSREHILNTTFKLFLKKSFKEVTMKEIVEATGLSKGAFYHYFESKEQLFSEVIEHFYAPFMNIDFDRFSHESLKKFYKEFLKGLLQKAEEMDKSVDLMDANVYFLIFDAMKILPGFKKLIDAQQKTELQGWLKIVQMARKSGEINPTMTDVQIAQFFIYSNDGVGIRLMLDGRMDDMAQELEKLWDGFYKQLKR